jgi:hypothetical protein
MDYFTKWLEVYTIPNQESVTLVDTLVTNLYYHFGVPRELSNSNKGCNFEFWFIQEVLEFLAINNTRTTPLHPQLDGMEEQYVKTVEEHLREVVLTHQRDWDRRLPTFLLSY